MVIIYKPQLYYVRHIYTTQEIYYNINTTIYIIVKRK